MVNAANEYIPFNPGFFDLHVFFPLADMDFFFRRSAQDFILTARRELVEHSAQGLRASSRVDNSPQTSSLTRLR